MQHLQFVTDYKKEDPLRTSFFALAAETFGLDLESWYQEGFWDSGLEINSTPYDSGLFVKTSSGFAFPEGIKHPVTSIA